MDIALKQRLVGASVLIALAVVVLPMLLGGRPDGDRQDTQKIELPAQPPELDFQTRKYPVGERPAPRPASPEPAPAKTLPTPVPDAMPVTQAAPDTVERPETDAPAPEPGAAAAGEEVAITPLPAPMEIESQPESAPAPAVSGGRYVVQVASFGALDNANRLAATLRSSGYSVMLDSIKSDAGTLHRVRVGPYGDEAQAEAAVRRIQSQVKNLKPRVMDLQPEKAAQVTKPSDPLVRWVVQVGSFSDAANADNLVAKLRLESMSAYKEEVTRAGSVIYRVRVGPFLEREDAIAANNRVAQRLSIDGVVMSAD
jgi:cell division septation protein DedD